jgi:hypothetical protein
VPDARAGVKVGQVRFVRAGSALLVTYGVKVFEFDTGKNAFSGPLGELSGAGMGVDQPTLDSVLATGTVPFIRLFPDLGLASRVFTFAPLELQAIDTNEWRATVLRGENPEFEFRGMVSMDQEHKGQRTAVAAILSRSRDDRQELQLRYVSGSDGLILAKDGRLLPPFATLSVPPGDLANQKPDTCQVSPAVSYLACRYWSKEAQGLVVWRLLGGDHPFERVAERYRASSAVVTGENELLVTTDKGLSSIADGRESKVAELSEDWRVATVEGRYIVALSSAAQRGSVFRRTGNGAEVALQPIAAINIVIVPGTDRALVQQSERLMLIDIAGGKTMWTAPIGELRNISIAKGSGQAVAVAAGAVYSLDLDSGRILKSHPVAMAPNGLVAAQPSGRKIGYLDSANKTTVLDLESGVSETIADAPAVATQLAWSNDGELLLVGGTDGSVLAWSPGRGRRWLVPTPFARAFQASAWPGQPPQGVVLNLALSRDGQRFAVLRQDIPNIDINDLTDGRLLTRLTPPWSTINAPAQVGFGPGDEIISAWAVHAMARDKPRFITVHKLPRNFAEALATASARLATLNTIWSPEGPPQESPGADSPGLSR